MLTKNWFTMSEEERGAANRRVLTMRLRQLQECTDLIAQIDEFDGDEHAEVLARLVENSLDAYMRLNKVNRPEEEYWVMSHLAWERRRRLLELREEKVGC
jgi:hypothetical protein